jgi:hypothetical protein
MDTPSGAREGSLEGVSSEGPDNKYAPGDPGLDGTSDVNFNAVAPDRFKPRTYKSGGDIMTPAPLT